MTKAEIIGRIIDLSGCKKTTVTRVVESMLSVIKRALENHELLQLRGFGKFKVVRRKSRAIVHPATRERLQLPSRDEPRFEPYPKFKEAVLEVFGQKVGADLQHRLQEARAEVDEGNALKAVKIYNSILNQEPREFKARIGLGLAYESLGEYQKAADEYNKVIKLQPNNVEAHYNLGAVCWEMGMIDTAQEEFKKALELDPSCADAHYNMGVALYKKGLYEKAILELEKAVAIDPEYTKSYYYLGTSYSQLQRHEKAIEVFEQLLEKEPHNRSVFWQLGLLYDKKGRHDEAVKMYRKANAPAEKDAHSRKTHKDKKRVLSDLLDGGKE
ncbi:MAG: tetratricopeptide repeat protein [Candidatus Latescibacteria bacterium]|nr:tetratricopeptide repeat protein [Candidatus Latescibacterota bacterium]